MALEPALTVFPTVEEILSEFSQTVTYNDVSAGSELSPPTSIPANIQSVTASHTDPGITIEISGNSVTISGKYLQAFTNKKWTYVPFQNPPSPVEDVFYNEIPSKIDSLVSYKADKTVSKLVTYTVSTSSGTATIEQTVTNNWDAGKAQMFEVKARGDY